MAIPSPTGLIDNQSKRKRKRRAGRGKSGVPETTGWRKRAAARWMEEAETAAAAMGRGKRRRAIDPDGGGGFGKTTARESRSILPAPRFGSAHFVSMSISRGFFFYSIQTALIECVLVFREIQTPLIDQVY
jgi:hypothetical protein